MANKERGEFRLVAGLSRYVLRLTTQSCCELEDFSARAFEQIQIGAKQHRLSDLRLMLWASLREHHGELATIDDAGLNATGHVIDEAGGTLGPRGRQFLAHVGAFMALNADSGEAAELEGTARPLRAQGWDWRRFYVDALSFGLSPDEFWRLSLRELWNVRRAYRNSRHDALEVEWMGEMFARQQRLPSLDSIIGGANGAPKPSGKMPWQVIKATITAMTEGVIPN